MKNQYKIVINKLPIKIVLIYNQFLCTVTVCVSVTHLYELYIYVCAIISISRCDEILLPNWLLSADKQAYLTVQIYATIYLWWNNTVNLFEICDYTFKIL